jgi:ferrochelatase
VLRARYDAIGGTHRLAAESERQREALALALGPGWSVALGYKHAPPFVEDAVAGLAAGGVERLAGVVLAPHDSAAGIGEYLRRFDDAAAVASLPATAVRSWHDLPEWLDLQALVVTAGLGGLPPRTTVLFTAHSLPIRAVGPDDPYGPQLAASAREVAQRAGLDGRVEWDTAWQSAGRTDDEWLRPALLDVLDDLAAAERADGVLVCPLGFTSEHLEVLYDLDIEARERAEKLGLAFARTPTPGADPSVMGALAERLATTVAGTATDR